MQWDVFRYITSKTCLLLKADKLEHAAPGTPVYSPV